MAVAVNPANLKVAAVVAFYMAAALVMVFVNKAVLNNVPELPLLFLLFQLLIAVVLLRLSAAITPKVTIPELDASVVKALLPVVSVNIIGLVFNTLCLRDVDASFFRLLGDFNCPPSFKVIGAAALVMLGFFIGVAPSSVVSAESSPSTLALFYGFMSSLFIAFHAVLIKSSLPHCHNSTIELAWWTNGGSAILLLPFIFLSGEPFKLWDMARSGEWDATVFFWGSVVTGVFGFLLCIAGLLSIKVTSPITHMFSSAARSVLQTILGVWIFHDLLNINRAASILVILGGTMLYTWIKSHETPPHLQPARDIEQGRGLFNANDDEEPVGLASEKHVETRA